MGERSAYSGAPAPTLVFDAGSSSIRARLVGADGRIVAGASRPYAYASEPDAGDLARAFDLPGCWAALTDAARETLASGKAPSAIAVTSQRQSLVLLDDSERPLYAGPNTDLRAIFQGAALDIEHGDAIYRTTGHRPGVHDGVGQARVAARHEAERLRSRRPCPSAGRLDSVATDRGDRV